MAFVVSHLVSPLIACAHVAQLTTIFAGLIAAGGSTRPPGLHAAPQTLYSLTFSGASQQAQSTHLPTAASHQTTLKFSENSTF